MHYDKIENTINGRNTKLIEVVYEFGNEICTKYFASNYEIQQWIEAYPEYDILKIIN
jgi:hypothetical protein